MAEVLKILKKVENGVESFFRGTSQYAEEQGLEVVGDVEDGVEADSPDEPSTVRLGVNATPEQRAAGTAGGDVSKIQDTLDAEKE